MIQYWHRIPNMPENYILQYVYRSQLEINRLGLKNWCNHIEDILIATDLQYQWDDQVIHKTVLALVKEKLRRFYEHNIRNYS